MRAGRWPAGGGEMASLVRKHDWAQTPLGPIEAWPQNLNTLVDLVLASEAMMCLMWGERATMVYNDSYAGAIGVRHPRALGGSALEVWADVRPVFEPLLRRALAGETAVERDLHLRFAGGVPREEAWFDLTYSPVPDERGNVLGVLATLAETTERVLAEREFAHTKAMLEESEARYRAFVTASSDAVYRMGPDWAEMRNLDGRGFISDTAEPTERWMERYIHEDDRALVKAAIGEAVRTKGVFELEHRVRRVDGTLGWTLSRAVPILGAGGEVLEWLGTARDVTERKRAEAALREIREAERARVGRELHDGPLQDLAYGLAEVRIAGMDLPNDPGAAATAIDQASVALGRVRDGLRASVHDLRLGRERDRPLSALAEALVERERSMATEVDVRLEVQDGFPSGPAGDAGAEVLRVVGEALTNARRHSGARNIRVSLGLEAEDLVVEVADDGSGFGPETAPGVGRGSMRERAEALGGILKVESEPARGTRVRLRVPMHVAFRDKTQDELRPGQEGR